jgi:hypothetical protein
MLMPRAIRASTDRSAGSWPDAVEVLRQLPIAEDMPAQQVRFALRQAIDIRLLHKAGIEGVFLFGSAARGEPPADLDWIIVSSAAEVMHRYGRIRLHGVECDINVVSREWVIGAWRDPEWGYWLTEAFPLAAIPRILDAWHTSANAYWSSAPSRARSAEYRELFALLANSSCELSVRAPLSARLLGHEAVRIALVALIDCYAHRPFSHRTFVEEATSASHLAEVDIKSILNGLGVGDRSNENSQSMAYVDVRRWISGVLRSREFRSKGYDRGATLRERIEFLSRLANSPGIERQLMEQRAHLALPTIDLITSSLDSAQSLLSRLARPTVPKSAPILQERRPTSSVHTGVRWLEHAGTRLKLIVGTGGCKTPTCKFCSLPEYGRSVGKFDLLQLNGLLEETHPTNLSLYNDGSLLNLAEFSREQWVLLCSILRRNGVRHLQIESIPRFVVKQRLEEIYNAAGLETLSIAMGLQAVGNAFSRLVLGRPDVDAIFERALLEAREAGARTRLYLLWGFGNLSDMEWGQKLRDALAWTSQRPVDRITICPFVSSSVHQQVIRHSICALRRTLADLAVPEDGHVDISLPVTPSCGIKYAGASCSYCEHALRASSWSRHGDCRFGGEVCI